MKPSKDIKSILDRLIGTRNTLSNNILFIDFTGSHEKAQLLSQMFYWSSRTKIPGGWFCKTYEDWFDEIRVKEHSIRRYVREFSNAGFVETTFKKFGGVPKLHYKLDRDILIEQLLTFCEANNLSPSQNITVEANNLSPLEADTVQPSINIDLEQRLKTERDAPAEVPEMFAPNQHEKTAAEIIRYLEANTQYLGAMAKGNWKRAVEQSCLKLQSNGEFFQLRIPETEGDYYKWISRRVAAAQKWFSTAADIDAKKNVAPSQAPVISLPKPEAPKAKIIRASAEEARKIARL